MGGGDGEVVDGGVADKRADVPVASEERVEFDDAERAGGQAREGGAGDEEKPLFMRDNRAIGGGIDESHFAVRVAHECQRRVKIQRARKRHALKAGRVVHLRADSNIAALTAEDHRCVGNVRAALPTSHLNRVAGLRHGIRAQVRAHEQCVQIHPAHIGLRLRQCEPIINELAARKIQLAHNHRVRPAAREPQQRTIMMQRAHGRALPHPVLIFSARKLIDVHQHLPLLPTSEILLRGSAAPHPAGMVTVTPEVV